MAEAIQKRERVGFDESVSAPFDEAPVRGGFLRQKPFVAEADEPIRNILGIQPQIFGFELLATAPEADADIAENALARERVEQGAIGFFQG